MKIRIQILQPPSAQSHLCLCLVDHPGRGGTGDTWAFLDKRTNEEVAIKFINRPLPKVLVQNIQREFTVRARSVQILAVASSCSFIPPPPLPFVSSQAMFSSLVRRRFKRNSDLVMKT